MRFLPDHLIGSFAISIFGAPCVADAEYFKKIDFVDLGALIMLSPQGKPQKIECGSYIAHFAQWSQINLASKQINIVRKNISRKKGVNIYQGT